MTESHIHAYKPLSTACKDEDLINVESRKGAKYKVMMYTLWWCGLFIKHLHTFACVCLGFCIHLFLDLCYALAPHHPSPHPSNNAVVPESSVAVLKGANDADVAVLASVEIFTIRQLCDHVSDVMDIVLQDEREHYRQLLVQAKCVLNGVEESYTHKKSISHTNAVDNMVSVSTQSNKMSSATASGVKKNQLHPPSRTRRTQTSQISKFSECDCPCCTYSRTDAVAALNRNREHLWVYHYVSETVYQQIKEEKILKSAYTLFNEYACCPPAERPQHAWKRVHHAYLRDAATWMGTEVEINDVTDADVFAFLVWKASSSFAALDCMAGPKAICFTWCPMPEVLREDAVCVDQVVAEDTGDSFVADRFSRIIAIDLMRMHNDHAAKIYRAEFVDQGEIVDNNKWIPTTLADAHQQVHFADDEKMWENFKSGEDYFSTVPHGCVVVGKGYIPSDCIMIEDDFPKALKKEIVIEQ